METYEKTEDAAEAPTAPTPKIGGYENPRDQVCYYLKEIKKARGNEAYVRFLRDGKSIIRKYKNLPLATESTNNTNAVRTIFNILWSNVQTLKPTLFSRVPKVVVERRLKNDDPQARRCATIAERCTQFSLSQEHDDFMYVGDLVVEDRLLPGRGTAREVFKCDKIEKQLEDGTVDPNYPTNEKSQTKYIYWEDFIHPAGRYWDENEVPWIAYRHWMDKRTVERHFGAEIAKKVKYQSVSKEDDDPIDPNDKTAGKRCEVLEIHDYWDRKVCWITEGYKEAPLKVEDDITRLDKFFPSPRPLFATTTTDSLIPVADYKLYDFLADELNYCLERISCLTECVRFVGFHDAAFDENIRDLIKIKDGTTVPVKNWAIYAERGGLKSSVEFVPVDKVASVISELVKYAQNLLQQIWEVTGMPDIVRGNSDPNETATAQQYKGQFATLRIAKKQADVQRFMADLIRIKAEIIFELFTDETIMQMADYNNMSEEDKSFFFEDLQILRDDKLRTYKVDIETDSTIQIDEEADKAARMEFITTLGELLNSSVQAMQLEPETKELMMETLKFGARGFRQGRELEATIEKTTKAILESKKAQEEAAANQPPPRDPAEVKAEADMMVAQLKGNIEMVKADNKVAIESMKAENKARIDEMLANHKMTLESMQAKHEAMLDTFKAISGAAMDAQKVRVNMTKTLATAQQQDAKKTISDMQK